MNNIISIEGNSGSFVELKTDDFFILVNHAELNGEIHTTASGINETFDLLFPYLRIIFNELELTKDNHDKVDELYDLLNLL